MMRPMMLLPSDSVPPERIVSISSGVNGLGVGGPSSPSLMVRPLLPEVSGDQQAVLQKAPGDAGNAAALEARLQILPLHLHLVRAVEELTMAGDPLGLGQFPSPGRAIDQGSPHFADSVNGPRLCFQGGLHALGHHVIRSIGHHVATFSGCGPPGDRLYGDCAIPAPTASFPSRWRANCSICGG